MMSGPDELMIFGEAVRNLSRNLREGGFSLDLAPRIIKQILGRSKFQKPMWPRFKHPSTKRICAFDSFEEFVCAPLLEGGLNTDIRTLKNLCRDDPESLDMIDMATQGKHGGNHNPTGKNQHKKEVKLNNVKLDQSPPPYGNSRQAALRRLRQSRPDLHAQVLSGEISAHSAMIQAGFRRKTITVPVEVDGVAKAISRHFSQSEIQELVTRLTKGIGQNAE